MAGKMHNMRPDIVHPIEHIFKRRGGQVAHDHAVTISGTSQFVLNVTYLGIRSEGPAGKHLWICREIKDPERLWLRCWNRGHSISNRRDFTNMSFFSPSISGSLTGDGISL